MVQEFGHGIITTDDGDVESLCVMFLLKSNGIICWTCIFNISSIIEIYNTRSLGLNINK